MPKQIARLTPGFLARVAETGLSDAAIAAAIGVTPQFYSQVKRGEKRTFHVTLPERAL